MSKPGDGGDDAVRALTRNRVQVASVLTLCMVVAYFGFVSLVAFAKPFMAVTLVPGLSLGIVLGALVILAAWVLTFIYVRWANGRYDPAVRAALERGA